VPHFRRAIIGGPTNFQACRTLGPDMRVDGIQVGQQAEELELQVNKLLQIGGNVFFFFSSSNMGKVCRVQSV